MSKQKTFIFLNSNAAKKGRVNGKPLPEGYVYLAKFFGCGIIDRTATLETGFEYAVLDPIKQVIQPVSSFAEICDAVGADLVDEALNRGCNLHVLWSGGIDSTVALVALLKRCTALDRCDLLKIYLSLDSINEYPTFYRNHIHERLETVQVAPPLSHFIDPENLIITGELGDQLFGSDKAKDIVQNGLAFQPYEEVLPILLTKKLDSRQAADTALAYLAPQIEQAPVSIETAYEYLWWMNFSLKWQQVSLRLPVFAKERVLERYQVTRHFFRDYRFQDWSLSHPYTDKIEGSWGSYKFPAKQYIFDFDGDVSYRDSKEKEPSLKSVLVNRRGRGNRRVRVYMTDSFKPSFKVFEKKQKPEWVGE